MPRAPGGPPAVPSSRAALLERIHDRLTGGSPRITLLRAPRGWGKRELLDAAVRRLAASGFRPIVVDFASSAVHPGESACALAVAALEAVTGAAAGPPDLPAEARLRSLAGSGALAGGAASAARAILEALDATGADDDLMVETALRLPALLAAEAGSSVILVAHGLDHLSRLAPYPGLRGIEAMAAEALRSDRVRVAASIAPEGRPAVLLQSLRSTLGEALAVEDLPPLEPHEVEAMAAPAGGAEAEPLARITGGRLLTARILASSIAAGASLVEALAVEMDPGGGRLLHELRFDYHLLIERTRGHAACRAALNVLAREEGLDLSGVAARLRRTPGATLDCLRWLAEVDLVARQGRRYRFSDPLLRLYVLLHELPEHPMDGQGREATVRSFLEGLHRPPLPLRPLGRPRGSRSSTYRPRRAPVPPALAQMDRTGARTAIPDDLIEID